MLEYNYNLPTNPVFPPCGTTAKLYKKIRPSVSVSEFSQRAVETYACMDMEMYSLSFVAVFQ